MTAPDGGPANRRPSPALDLQVQELEIKVTDLGNQVTDVATDVSKIGAQLQDEISQLGDTVAKLADHVMPSGDDESDQAGIINWHTLDRVQAEKAWSELWHWLESYYVPTFEPTRTEIPDCWTRHAGIRDELSWLWRTHLAAYADGAQPTAAAYWHTTWRTSAMTNIEKLVDRFDCSPGMCRGENTGGASDAAAARRMGKRERLVVAEHWLTDGIQDDLQRRP